MCDLKHYINSLLSGVILTSLVMLSFSSCKKESEKIMSVSNDSISEISYTSAKAYATIIDKGEGIEQYGHCWSTSASLTEVDNEGKTQLGSTSITGSFSSNLTNLTPGTKYYVRSYIKNSNNIAYGDDILDFHTLALGLPVVSTGTASSITTSSATIGGNIESLGSGASSVSQHGHCWSDETTTPTLSDKFTSLGTKNTTGTFESGLTGLSPEKLYYVRAYATNSLGTAYGDAVSFTTLAQPGVPVVTTGIITDVTENSATAAGSLDDFGSGASSVTQHGHCWSNTTSTPTISDNVTTLGSRSTTGDFESPLTGLSADQIYYVRAYATNDAGTGYGYSVPFSTDITEGAPQLITTEVASITGTTAVSGGTITSEGGSAITAKGICWSTSSGPTLADDHTYEGSGPGAFESTMTGLAQNWKYYVKAYATNTSGTGYGNQIVFTTNFDCGTRFTDPRDDKSYLTVMIGDQCWMAENLNVGTKLEGKKIPGDNEVIEKHCYNDDENNCDLYGALYRWDEMMNHTTVEMTTGICPKGWHIPSDFEWKTMEKALGMTQEQADGTGWRGTDEGGKLKAAGTTYWESPNSGATNSSLFTALPSGGVDNEGNYSGLGYYADYWTSTLIIDTQCWYRYLSADESRIYRVDGNRNFGTAVRCVQDD
jgi:uncharacterized protein (TIGR02145 family)